MTPDPPHVPARRRRHRGRTAHSRVAPTPARRSGRGRQEVHRRPRGEAPAAGSRRRAGLVERQHHRQGRGLQEEGRGPEQDRRRPRRHEARSPSSRRSRKPDKGEIDDPLLARQIDVLYLAYLEKQVDPELLKKITAKANAVEKAFNVFRAKVDGKEMTDSEVRKVLKELERLRTRGRRSGRRARGSARSSRPT